MRPSIHRLSIVCFAVLVVTRAAVGAPWGTLEQAEALFKQADQSEHVTVEVVGRSVEGRPIHAVRIASVDREKAREPVVAMLVGLQHGDEPAAGRALLDLIRDVAADRSILPATLDLHVIPIANPDGAVADRRRNANEFDLNRDHQLLSQPETVALHAYARRVRPHLVVDGHEFNRTTSDYLERGWTEWPIITLGACNSPLLPSPLPAAANALIDQVDAEVNAAGFNFTEYLVGDAPTVP
ncbi:MAG: M14 family zinc carboxypeptidase, partial [Planctomycetota bacterium]